MCLHKQPVVISIAQRNGSEVGHEPTHQRTVRRAIVGEERRLLGLQLGAPA